MSIVSLLNERAFASVTSVVLRVLSFFNENICIPVKRNSYNFQGPVSTYQKYSHMLGGSGRQNNSQNLPPKFDWYAIPRSQLPLAISDEAIMRLHVVPCSEMSVRLLSKLSPGLKSSP